MQRRYFLYGSLAAAGAVRSRAVAASDKVTIALMGIGGRGRSMAEYFGPLPDVRIPIVCDVDSNVVGPVIKKVAGFQGREPTLISDIRRALDDKEIDAIVMATPIHWHAPGTILACSAGKDFTRVNRRPRTSTKFV